MVQAALLAEPSIARDRDARALLAVLTAAHVAGLKLTDSQLYGMLYFCDLRAAEARGRRFTSLRWQWLKSRHGLVSDDARVEKLRHELERASLLPSGPRELPDELGSRLEYILEPLTYSIAVEVVAEYGHMHGKVLDKEVYETWPAEQAQRESDRDLTDLDVVPHTNDWIGRTLQSARLRFADNTPAQTSVAADSDWTEHLRIMQLFQPLRIEATRV